MRLKQSVPEVVPVLLLDTNGDPLTGITAPTVTLRKKAVAAAAKAVTNGANWVEVSASLMPGWYDLTLAAGDLDTLGKIDVQVKTASSKYFRASHFVVAAIEVCRPLPWLEAKPVRAREIAAELFKKKEGSRT